MKVRETKAQQAIREHLSIGQPVLVWGDPGVGKTRWIQSLAQEMGMHIETVIGSVREPTDFLGLPYIDEESRAVRFHPPVWVKRIVEKGGGIVFFDELTTCSPSVQHAMLRIILEGEIGEIKFPPDTLFIAAANPPQQIGGYDISLPLSNRFAHVKWEVDARVWCENFLHYWGNPPRVRGLEERRWARARAIVASYIRVHPDALIRVPERINGNHAWPSHRTWDFVSRSLALHLDNPTETPAHHLVGEGSAVEFINWLQKLDLPDPEEVLANAHSFPVNLPDDRLYAILGTLGAVIANDKLPREKAAQRAQNALVYMMRVGHEGEKPDVALAGGTLIVETRMRYHELPFPELPGGVRYRHIFHQFLNETG